MRPANCTALRFSNLQVLTDGVAVDSNLSGYLANRLPLNEYVVPYGMYLIHPEHPRAPVPYFGQDGIAQAA